MAQETQEKARSFSSYGVRLAKSLVLGLEAEETESILINYELSRLDILNTLWNLDEKSPIYQLFALLFYNYVYDST